MSKEKDDRLDLKETGDVTPWSEDLFGPFAHFACDWNGWLGSDGKPAHVTPSCRQLTGYDRREFLENPNLITDIIHREDREQILNHFNEDFTIKEAFQKEFRIVRKDGDVRWIRHICRPVYSREGKWLGRYYSNRDISDYKFSENALIQSEEKYRNIVESSNDGICIIQNDIIRFSNKRLADMIGFAREEILETPFFDHVHPDELTSVVESYERFVSGEKEDQRFETVLFNPNGTPLDVELSISPTFHENQRAALIMVRDITGLKQIEKEKRELEKILQQTQRMEAIGTLAGGIAHEFNNILWIISANTEYALEILKDGGAVINNLQRIERACSRAADLVGQILSFSRQQQHAPKPLDMRAIVKETLKFMRASLPKTIEINPQIAGDLRMVMADPTQLHQVVTNLCTNAFYAMREAGGILEVSLDNIDAGETSSFPVGMAPGKYVRLRVKDTGIGMEPEVMKRVFEPFFTTRQPGEGAGLGLSVVYGIVESYHGAVTVGSRPGEGSVFEVFLPVIEEKSEAETRRPRPIPTGKERILFVDDEKEIADITREVLESLGYRVHVENNPAKALKVFGKRSDEFSLVITDMTMPGMTGEVLARKLIDIRADIPIIICTGYGEVIGEARTREMGVREILRKPATIGTVAETVRRVLDKK
ncbi:MAG: PAS domain S-box protein [Deltaproteobacteria bacterium]|nr:PAS domain S-box protein [Deltaproteobacteria bacterium]